MLGPNGAGKTSTIETLEGYRRPVGGRVRVLGLDPQADQPRSPGASASCCSGAASTRCSGPARSSTSSPATTRPGAHRRPARPGGAARRGGDAVAPPLGRGAATALAGAGAHRPAPGRLPGRADGRRRPRGPPGHPRVVADLRSRACAWCSPPTSSPRPRRWPTASSSCPPGGWRWRGRRSDLTAATGTPPDDIRRAARPGHGVAGGGARGVPGQRARDGAGSLPDRGRGAAGPAATAVVATWLAERDATLTDLVAGRTLEDVYFDAVGAAAGQPDSSDDTAADRRRRRRRGRAAVSARPSWPRPVPRCT